MLEAGLVALPGHIVAWVLEQNELAGHGVHVSAPIILLYKPLSQLTHTSTLVAPIVLLYVPAAHLEQLAEAFWVA